MKDGTIHRLIDLLGLVNGTLVWGISGGRGFLGCNRKNNKRIVVQEADQYGQEAGQ